MEPQKENLAGTFLEIAREHYAQPATTRMFCPCCCEDQNFVFLGDFGLDERYRCPNELCGYIKFVRVR